MTGRTDAGDRSPDARVRADGRPSPGRPATADLARHVGEVVPDLLPAHLRLLLVGINPSPWTAATGAHFARPGNRFYLALAAGGITPYVVDAAAGYRPADLDLLTGLGIGITNLVPRATARADELTRDELAQAPARLEAVVHAHRPRVVAFLGVTSYRSAFGRPRARAGRQPEPRWGAIEFVLPNPSGLNAHETVASLGAAYREAALAAGVVAS